jgi:hypothetical protein
VTRVRETGALAMGLVAAGAACTRAGEEAALSLTWRLEALGAGPVDCAAAGAPTVELEARALGSEDGRRFPFDCAAGGALARLPASDPRAVTVRLLDARPRVLAELVFPQAVPAQGGVVVDLGAVVFELLTFSFGWRIEDAGGTTLDCAAAGGADVQLDATAAGATQTFTFPCAAGRGRSPAIVPGTYQLRFGLRAAGGAELASRRQGDVQVSANVTPGVPDVVFVVGHLE